MYAGIFSKVEITAFRYIGWHVFFRKVTRIYLLLISAFCNACLARSLYLLALNPYAVYATGKDLLLYNRSDKELLPISSKYAYYSQ